MGFVFKMMFTKQKWKMLFLFLNLRKGVSTLLKTFFQKTKTLKICLVNLKLPTTSSNYQKVSLINFISKLIWTLSDLLSVNMINNISYQIKSLASHVLMLCRYLVFFFFLVSENKLENHTTKGNCKSKGAQEPATSCSLKVISKQRWGRPLK